jgi:alpha-beta hydrolase superfamily lysophospholipase
MLHRFLAEVVGEPVVLVGHSMGAVAGVAVHRRASGPGDPAGVLSPSVPGSTGRTDRVDARQRGLSSGCRGWPVVRRKLAG